MNEPENRVRIWITTDDGREIEITGSSREVQIDPPATFTFPDEPRYTFPIVIRWVLRWPKRWWEALPVLWKRGKR